MQQLRLVPVLLLVILFNACSDSSSPQDGSPGNNTTEFKIVSVDQDSVYLGDRVVVQVKGAQTDSFSLFLHTLKIAVDSIAKDSAGRDLLFFHVPANAGSGQIRIFKYDTIQAAGNYSLTVLQRDRKAMQSSANHFMPARGYDKDLIVITGKDIPMRWRDIGVMVNDVPMVVESWDSVRIYARVTPEVKTGILKVRLFDKITTLSTFRKLEHEGELLPNGRISRITVLTHGLIGSTRRTSIYLGDTNHTDLLTIKDLNTNTSSFTVLQTPHPDSLIFVGEQESASISKWIDVRLKAETESRVSGVIRFGYVDHGTKDKARQTVELTIKGMRWMNAEGAFILHSHAYEIVEQMPGFFCMDADGFSTFYTETLTYAGGKAEGWVNIVLSP